MSSLSGFLNFAVETLKIVNPTKIERVGARFFLISDNGDFERSRNAVASVSSRDVLEKMGGKVSDVMHVFELKLTAGTATDGRVTFGPFRKAELGKWFQSPAKISAKEGILYDCDWYVSSWSAKSVKIVQFVEDCYAHVHKVVDGLNSALSDKM